MSEKERTLKLSKIIFSINEKVAQIYFKLNGEPSLKLEAEGRKKSGPNQLAF